MGFSFVSAYTFWHRVLYLPSRALLRFQCYCKARKSRVSIGGFQEAACTVLSFELLPRLSRVLQASEEMFLAVCARLACSNHLIVAREHDRKESRKRFRSRLQFAPA